MLLLAGFSHAATFTWDGGGSDNNFTSGLNWSGDVAPDRSASADLIFAGTTRLTPNANWGGWTVNSLTFGNTAGAFTLSGGELTIGAGGVVNNSANTQTIQNQIKLSADQTWNAADGAIVSTGYFSGNSKNLTLTGASAITIGGQLNGVGTLNLAGSGNRTFGGQVGATTVNAAGTGTTSFNAQLNVGTLNISAGTNNFANVQASSGINISGSANANFTGPVTGGSSGVNISSSGNVNFTGSINSGSLTLNGSGTTTISGSGQMSTGAVTVNNGTLILDHNGSAINSTLTINDGGTVVFASDNQIPSWQSVTLNEGSTLYLGDTTQTFASLIINGDSVIDFGSGGSQLNITYGGISIANEVTITILNWSEEAGDVFYGGNINNPDAVVHVQYADNDGNIYATATWTGSSNSNGYVKPGSPVPEPSTYGLVMLGSGIVFFIWRRRSQAAARRSSVDGNQGPRNA